MQIRIIHNVTKCVLAHTHVIITMIRDVWVCLCLRRPIVEDRKAITVIEKNCFVVKEKNNCNISWKNV